MTEHIPDHVWVEPGTIYWACVCGADNELDLLKWGTTEWVRCASDPLHPSNCKHAHTAEKMHATVCEDCRRVVTPKRKARPAPRRDDDPPHPA